MDFIASEPVTCPECYHLRRKLDETHKQHNADYLLLKKRIISTSSLIKKFNALNKEKDGLEEKNSKMAELVQQLKSDCSKYENNLGKQLQKLGPLEQDNKKLSEANSAYATQIEQLNLTNECLQKTIAQLEAQHELNQAEIKTAKAQENSRINPIRKQISGLHKKVKVRNKLVADLANFLVHSRLQGDTKLSEKRKLLNHAKRLLPDLIETTTHSSDDDDDDCDDSHILLQNVHNENSVNDVKQETMDEAMEESDDNESNESFEIVSTLDTEHNSEKEIPECEDKEIEDVDEHMLNQATSTSKCGTTMSAFADAIQSEKSSPKQKAIGAYRRSTRIGKQSPECSEAGLNDSSPANDPPVLKHPSHTYMNRFGSKVKTAGAKASDDMLSSTGHNMKSAPQASSEHDSEKEIPECEDKEMEEVDEQVSNQGTPTSKGGTTMSAFDDVIQSKESSAKQKTISTCRRSTRIGKQSPECSNAGLNDSSPANDLPVLKHPSHTYMNRIGSKLKTAGDKASDDVLLSTGHNMKSEPQSSSEHDLENDIAECEDKEMEDVFKQVSNQATPTSKCDTTMSAFADAFQSEQSCPKRIAIGTCRKSTRIGKQSPECSKASLNDSTHTSPANDLPVIKHPSHTCMNRFGNKLKIAGDKASDDMRSSTGHNVKSAPQSSSAAVNIARDTIKSPVRRSSRLQSSECSIADLNDSSHVNSTKDSPKVPKHSSQTSMNQFGNESKIAGDETSDNVPSSTKYDVKSPMQSSSAAVSIARETVKSPIRRSSRIVSLNTAKSPKGGTSGAKNKTGQSSNAATLKLSPSTNHSGSSGVDAKSKVLDVAKSPKRSFSDAIKATDQSPNAVPLTLCPSSANHQKSPAADAKFVDTTKSNALNVSKSPKGSSSNAKKKTEQLPIAVPLTFNPSTNQNKSPAVVAKIVDNAKSNSAPHSMPTKCAAQPLKGQKISQTLSLAKPDLTECAKAAIELLDRPKMAQDTSSRNGTAIPAKIPKLAIPLVTVDEGSKTLEEPINNSVSGQGSSSAQQTTTEQVKDDKMVVPSKQFCAQENDNCKPDDISSMLPPVASLSTNKPEPKSKSLIQNVINELEDTAFTKSHEGCDNLLSPIRRSSRIARKSPENLLKSDNKSNSKSSPKDASSSKSSPKSVPSNSKSNSESDPKIDTASKHSSLFNNACMKAKARSRNIISSAPSWCQSLPAVRKRMKSSTRVKLLEKTVGAEDILRIMQLPDKFFRPISPIVSDYEDIDSDDKCAPPLLDDIDKELFGDSSDDDDDIIESSKTLVRQSSGGFEVLPDSSD